MNQPRLSRTQIGLHTLLATTWLFANFKLSTSASQIRLSSGESLSFIATALSEHPTAFTSLAAQFLAILALHGLFIAALIQLSRPGDADEERAHPRRGAAYSLLTWISAVWLLLHFHHLAFPRSIWAWMVLPITEQPLGWIADTLAGFWLAFRVYKLTVLVARMPATYKWLSIGLPAISAIVWILWHFSIVSPTPTEAGARPNLVVIGLDSVRRDIALFDSDELMPTLASIRNQGYVEANVVSPLARTFPAWTTILTGLPPSESGARDNLAPRHHVRSADAIPLTLRQNGYRTIFASDETRFSNISKEFGFDEIIAPSAGLADFVLGAIGDQPLLNFFLQIPRSEWLLPSLAGNRALAHAYRPARFIKRLSDALGRADGRPTALFIHLCLAHWPYFTAQTPLSHDSDPEQMYRRATRELDSQLSHLFRELKRLGYVDSNTLTVLLSDHGEETEPWRSRPQNILPEGASFPPLTQLGGHGANLLSPREWQVFLIFSGRSAQGPIPRGKSDQLASLSDLAPTLLQLLGVAQSGPAAASLEIAQAQNPLTAIQHPDRAYVALETAFRPASFDPLRPDQEKALSIAAEHYRVTRDGRLEFRPDAYEQMIESKDRGLTNGHDILAIMKTAAGEIPILALRNGTWVIGNTETRPALTPMADSLVQAACAHPDFTRFSLALCKKDSATSASSRR